MEEKNEYFSSDRNDTKKTCEICFLNDADSVLMECGHGGIFLSLLKD